MQLQNYHHSTSIELIELSNSKNAHQENIENTSKFKTYVLVVDDMPGNRKVLKVYLKAFNNITIVECTNGKEAVDYVEKIKKSS